MLDRSTASDPVAFRQVAIPKLRGICQLHAPRIARGHESVTTAITATMRIAADLGADDLPPRLLADLREWVKTTIIDEARNAKLAMVKSRGRIL